MTHDFWKIILMIKISLRLKVQTLVLAFWLSELSSLNRSVHHKFCFHTSLSLSFSLTWCLVLKGRRKVETGLVIMLFKIQKRRLFFNVFFAHANLRWLLGSYYPESLWSSRWIIYVFSTNVMRQSLILWVKGLTIRVRPIIIVMEALLVTKKSKMNCPAKNTLCEDEFAWCTEHIQVNVSSGYANQRHHLAISSDKWRPLKWQQHWKTDLQLAKNYDFQMQYRNN